MTSYDGRAVANFVLDICDQNGRDVTNLALQKVVYFCHVWSLVQLNKPLIKQNFEAWEYGPVLPYLYREFRVCDRRPIKGRAKRVDPKTGESRIVECDFDDETKSLLLKVIEFYSRITPSDLVELSHAEGGPWHDVWNHSGKINPGMKIANEQIAKFYSSIPVRFLRQ